MRFLKNKEEQESVPKTEKKGDPEEYSQGRERR